MTPRAHADARRARGLLLAFVLVVSQASAWFHAVAISHVACLEHGEAVHGAFASPAPADAARAADQGEVDADLATDAGHDHCANAALLRWRDVALTAPANPLFVLTARAPAPAPFAIVFTGTDLFRLAPKTSPPSAAV